MADKNESPYISTGQRARSFLLPAILISILIHLIGGPLIPFKQTHTQDQQVEKVSETKKTKIVVPTPPPPTPTPRPTEPPKSTPPPQKQAPQPKALKINTVKTTSNNKAGAPQNAYVAPKNSSVNGVPNAQGTAAAAPAVKASAGPAAPTPTPAPKCAVPYRDAVATNKVPPDYPEMARQQNLGVVTVLVKVTVGPTGSLQAATVQQSSGNSSIDQAAIAAAKASSYSAKVVNCTPVAGDYGFTAEFDPGN
ncbi:MAG: TonB family protein [Candidatus Eremiobacteraeota bacterium]|nr:TonB family protein [Candidatus Eremiobacteraeota bacterium]